VEAELDLKAASRETLLALIAEQQVVIAQLQRRIGALESRLNRRRIYQVLSTHAR